MRSLRPLAVGALALAILIAACGGGAAGWTYAPAPSVTPPPSVSPSDGGSPAPSDGGSPAPSDGGSAAPSDGGPGGTAVQISAVNIAFDQSSVEVPADTAFRIEFANNDPGTPHNVEIKDDAGTSVFMGEVFNGVETRTYDVPALAAGSYTFICTVHPNMTGTLTAG